MADAFIGYGSKFEVGDGDSPEVFTELSEVTDITLPSETVETVDVTHMQSPDRRREYIAGLSDTGEATISMAFIPGSDGDVLLRSMAGTGDVVSCRVTFPNQATWTFQGFLTGYTPTLPLADKATADVSFKVTGSVVAGT